MDKRKNEGIEFLRMCATVGVIVNHIGICWISSFGNVASSESLTLFRIINGLAAWPVPIFMMITGSLLMSKKEIDYRVSFKYFKRIAILLLFFGTLFAFIELYFKYRTISAGLLVHAIKNMIEGNSWKHLWYLYMLLGVYLILPILKNTPPKSHQGSTIIMLVLLIFGFNSLLPYLNWQIGIDFPIKSVYVGYFLLGHILMNDCCNILTGTWLKNYVCSIGIVVLFAMVIIGNCMGCKIHFSGYHCPFTVIQAALIFVLVVRNRQMFGKFMNLSITKKFNRCSLGIYILHMFWINITTKVLHINIINSSIGIIIAMLLLIVGLSWLSTLVLLKVPIIKKYL